MSKFILKSDLDFKILPIAFNSMKLGFVSRYKIIYIFILTYMVAKKQKKTTCTERKNFTNHN